MAVLHGWRERLQAWRREPGVIWRRVEEAKDTRVEVRQWLALPVLLVLLVWYIAAPSATVAALLASVAALLGLAYAWASRLARCLGARRQLESAAMQVGDELEEQVSLGNASFFPALWVELVDHSNLPGYVVSGVRGLGGFSSTSWRAHTICSLRGVYRLGPWELRTGDPFGIFAVTQVYRHRQEVLVYPPLAPLPPDLMPHRGLQGDHRPLRQPIQSETIDSMTVRPYQPGDPLRHIHWLTSARLQAPYVKVFEPQTVSRIWLVPDLDPTAQWGEGVDSTEETMILLAASLAADLLRQKFTSGLFAGGDSPQAVLPQNGVIHLWPILECLAPLHPQPGVSLARSLEQIRPLLTQRDLLVLITAALREDWVLAARRLLGGRSGTFARALLLDPASFGGPAHAEAFLPALADAGLEGKIIRRGELQAIAGAYGPLSRWEFTTSGTGRAVARLTPRRAAAIFAGQKAVD